MISFAILIHDGSSIGCLLGLFGVGGDDNGGLLQIGGWFSWISCSWLRSFSGLHIDLVVIVALAVVNRLVWWWFG